MNIILQFTHHILFDMPYCLIRSASTFVARNRNVVPWTLFTSPNKESSNHGGSRSPLPAQSVTKRTSPVAVPVPGRRRQRNESTSSGGSWQMISGTGSLRGTTTANAPIADQLSSLNGRPYGSPSSGNTSVESSTTIIEDEPGNSYAQ